jgi:hypothetical protein
VETHARRLIRDELAAIADGAFAETVARRRRELSDAADRAIEEAIARYDDKARVAQALAEERETNDAKNLRVRDDGLFVVSSGVTLPWNVVGGLREYVRLERRLHSELVTLDNPLPRGGVTYSIGDETAVAVYDATLEKVRIELAGKSFTLAAGAFYAATDMDEAREWWVQARRRRKAEGRK